MAAQMNDSELLFPESLNVGGSAAAKKRTEPSAEELAPWKIVIVDDDKDVHAVTQLVLADFRFKSRRVKLFSAYSAMQAKRVLKEEDGIAVVLLDVVMETEHAGLELVHFIREEIDKRLIRIILRTGQPGQAPEDRVIADYDINDYREKSELSAQKLISAVTAALRSYDDLLTIESLALSNEWLETQVQERTVALMASNQLLQQHRTLLDGAQRIANIGNYEWNPIVRHMVCSDQLRHILGLHTGATLQGLEGILDMVPMPERLAVRQAIEATSARQPDYDLQHAVCRADGQIIHVHHQGEARFDAQGHLVQLVGIFQDVTERRRTEDTMRKLSMAVEQTADAVMITDAAGTIEYVNAAFCRMTGYTNAEVVGQTPKILKSGSMPEVYFRRMWTSVLRGEVFSDVLVNRRKDGEIFHESVTISPQRGIDGKVTHFIVTGRDITDQIQVQQRIEHMALHDPLTDLPNRILLLDRLTQAIARVKWRGRLVAVLFMDMDRFKIINDTLGHVVGDDLLRQLAGRLRAAVRDGDTVARLGGDEFAVVLNDVASRQDIADRAEVILGAVRDPFLIGGRELFVTLSIGVSVFPDDGENNLTLLKRADVAMYNVKIRGKNNYQFYTERDEAKELARLELETDLRRALERKEFFLMFQPQVDAGSRRICAMEALLRWRRQDGRIVPPGEFIGLLEETGMIVSVGDWVMEQACVFAKNMSDDEVCGCRVAVNISIAQFRQRDFVQRVREILSVTGLAPERLELEITEGVLVEDMQQAARILTELNEVGVRLSIDDFGTGYSSMHYLRRLPFDMIKIDKSFVDGLPDSSDSCAIVKAIITMAQSMGLEVIAEGVELDAQFDFVRQLGCQLIQGYLFCPPVAEQVAQDWKQGKAPLPWLAQEVGKGGQA